MLGDYIITKTLYPHRTQYLIWHPEDRIREDGMLHGEGLEIIIEGPRIEYTLPSDIPNGGWDRAIKLPSVKTLYGYTMGSVPDELGTPSMFSVIYTPPVCNNIHSSRDSKYFAMGLIGFAELDTFYRFGISAHSGTSMSKYGMEITKKLNSLDYLKPATSFTKNDREKLIENEFYYVQTDPGKMYEVDPNDYLLGKKFVWETIKNNKRKNIKESDIQLELF